MPNASGVCTLNFLDTATMTESSEKAVYPATNVLDIQRRKRVWRTNGNWLMATGGNELIFREASGGSDLTATVPVGTYATTALFLAALKAAMELVGNATYTCTQLASGKIQITSSLTGSGVTAFQLRMADAGSTLRDALGFGNMHYTGDDTYEGDEVRIHTEEWLLWDFGVASRPKAFCIVGDRNNPVRISPTAVVKLQANPTSNFSTVAWEATIPVTDNALALWDFDGLADQAYRYWRFVIVDRDNSRLYLEFGAAFLGDMLNFSRGCPVFPLRRRGRDPSVLVVSEGGQVWGLKKPKTMGIVMTWKGLTVAEQEQLLEHWENVGITDNFFLILDAQGSFSTTPEANAKLVRFAENYEDQLESPTNLSAGWSLEEAL